jgi:hypothetical protein
MLTVHKRRHAIVRDLFPGSCCRDLEARTLVHYAVLCHALGYRDLAAEFEDLAEALGARVRWGNTVLERSLYAVGGASLCGGMIGLKRHIVRRLTGFRR